MVQLLLFEPEGPVDDLDEHQDDWLPADEPTQPIQKLAVHHVWLLPRRREHPLQVNLKQFEVLKLDQIGLFRKGLCVNGSPNILILFWAIKITSI